MAPMPDPSATRVRPVEPRDRDAWVKMRAALYDGEDIEALASEVDAFLAEGEARDLVAVLVAERRGPSLLGFVEIGLRSYAEGCVASPVPYVEGWFVAAEARRTGIGRALIDAAERWTLENGYRELASDALIDNVTSERAHKALGFQEVERSIHFRKRLLRD